ncbi:MAG TPA: gliding motility protein GldC [Bacteroidia bacterium]|jgi:gliding motility-associated protein GldC|nr:gliding motility protein GldC [Bacteroidia bacterium]
MKKAEINFKITLDENNLPVNIEWTASDTGDKGQSKAIMLAMWDEKEMNTLRIDLWTKEMKVDEMKRFFHQNLLTMSDTFKRATGEENIVEDLKDYCAHFAEKMELDNPAGSN